jgi:CheY-like chemotaxis protein
MDRGLPLFRGDATLRESRSVVILDDHADHVETLALLFCAWGYSVRCAKAATDALEGLQLGPPTALVVDIGKTHLCGLEIVRRMRSSIPPARTLVIALSSYARQDTADQAIAAGCHFFFTKPVDPDKLQTLLRSL